MIAHDQPTIFPPNVIANVSSVDDGNMKKGGFPTDQHAGIDQKRQEFLGNLGITMEQTVLVNLSYDKDDFTEYKVVDTTFRGKGITLPGAPVSDALVTITPGVALFLPIADCVGAILYDQSQKVLMVSHLGRHATEQYGARKSVEYLVSQFDSDPKDILVWLSPSPSKESYPLFTFGGESLEEVTRGHLLDAGVLVENIASAGVDTATSQDYFSHSEFLKGNRDSDGRYAIVAMLK